MRRPLVLALLSLLLLLALGGTDLAAGYRVAVDGQAVAGANATLRGGQLMGAVEPLARAIGASYRYNPATYGVTLRYGRTTVDFWMGTQLGEVNGQKAWLPVAPFLSGGAPQAPLWWLATVLGCDRSYSSSTQTLSIRTPFPPGNVAPPPVDHPLFNPSFVFPYASGALYSLYSDTWGAPRDDLGKPATHEGNDIMAPRGTPVYAVAAGTIIRLGWNTLGGYRVTVRLDAAPDYAFYYAHFDRYAPGLQLGGHVATGQLLGYTGNTGNGPERTEGQFPPHLHFGIYGPGFRAMDPYYFLRDWEPHKAR